MPATEEQLKNRRIWIAALESGKFKQGTGELGSPEDGLCCLGVGCFVLGLKYDPEASYPTEAFCRKVGLPFDDALGIEREGQYCGGTLVNDNDEKKLSFPEIAKIIATEETLWVESDYQEGILQDALAVEREDY